MEKPCSKCKTVKPLAKYRPDKSARDGRRSECAACTRAYHTKWRRRNAEKVRADRRKWYRENKEKVSEYAKEWYKKHPGYSAEQSRRFRAKNPERAKAVRREYFKKTRGRHRQRERKYRARKLNATIESVTEAGWLEIVDIYQSRCAYCGIASNNLTMDHVVALFHGGTHSYDNIVPACKNCNSKKGAKTLEEAGMRFVIPRIYFPSQK